MEELVKQFLEKETFTQEELYKTFSLEDRLFILFNNLVISERLIGKCKDLNIIFLTPEEAYKTIKEKKEIKVDGIIYFEPYRCAEYLNQDQLFELSYDESLDAFGFFVYLTKTEYIAKLIDDKIITSKYILKMIERMDNDEVKKQYMFKYLDRDNYFRVIRTLKNDESKMASLSIVPRKDRPDVIKSFDEDENKEKYIYTMGFNRSTIIKNLKSDLRKEYYLNKLLPLLTAYEKAEIIYSFSDKEFVKKYLYLLKSDNAIVAFFEIGSGSSKYDDIKIELSKKIKREKNVLKCFINGAKTPKVRDALLNRLRSPKAIMEAVNRGGVNISRLLQFMDMVNDDDKVEIIRHIKNPKALFESLSKIDKRLIPSLLEHVENFPPYEEKYRYIAEVYASTYKLNLEHLITLLKIVGCTLLNNLENANLMHAINLNDDEFAKYLKIINEKNITVDYIAQNSAINSIIQRMFRIKEKDSVEFAGHLVDAIDRNDQVTMRDMLTIMYTAGVMTREEVVSFYRRIKVDDKTKLKEDLKPFTKKYINLKRVEFYHQVVEDNKDELFKITVSDKSFERFVFNEMTNQQIIDAILEANYFNPFFFTAEEKKLVENISIIEKILIFKRNPKNNSLTNEEKKYIPIFTDILNKTLRTKVYVDYSEDPELKEELKETDMISVINVMKSINVDALKKNIFNDEELFNELITFLDKNRIIGWSNRFITIAVLADIDISEGIIAELINNYGYIKERIKAAADAEGKEPQYTVAKMLDEASIFDSYSFKYTLLFGRENFAYLKANPGTFSGSGTKEERINKALSYIPKMHERKTIPVPGIDKNYETEKGKRLNVVVGNTTDLINLTLGERTDACMRISGFAESLLEYTLMGKNGFNIVFTDPNTGEFVSRVSCFRNGNTIFMNQLRHSVLKKYDDQDLIEVLTKVSEDLINLTKDGPMPINNIVIDSQYGMEISRLSITNIGVDNIKKGLPSFHSDVGKYAIVLKTSDKDNKLVPINLNPNIPSYTPTRAKIRYHYEESPRVVAHYKVLDAILNHHSMDEIDIVINEDIVACISGEDWYVSIDKYGKIDEFILKKAKNPKLSKQEMEQALLVLKEKIKIKEQNPVKKLA